MIHPKYQIIIALIIAVLFLNLSGQGMFMVAHEAEESGHSSARKLSIFNIESQEHCPACPSEDHKNTDHSHCCEHHSSLYFVFQSLLISYYPITTSNNMHEVNNTFPEVYLEKFIPPIIPSDMLV